MKLRISRKIFILFILLFIISLIAGAYLYVKRSRTTMDGYLQELESYCETTGDMLEKELLCKAFMIGELESEESERCFWLLVYDGEGSLVDFKICEETNLIDWDNPYGDYEKHVPVVMGMTIRQSFLGENRLKNAKFTLMEDQEMFDILDTLPEGQGRASYFQSQIYIRKHQEIFDRGYYMNSPRGSDIKDLLVLYDVELEELSVRGGELLLSINTSIHGEELSLLITTEEFLFSGPEFEDEILIDVEEADAFDYDGSFFVYLKFDLEEVEVEEYLKSLLEAEEEDIVLSEEFKLLQMSAK